MVVCQVCGNEISNGTMKCRFCGNRQESEGQIKSKEFIQKTVNLEQGRPTLEVALQKLSNTINDAGKNNVTVLTLIHGYGSSGKGGLIRLECRKSLDYMKRRGQILDFINGEDFFKGTGKTKSLIQRYPQLSADKNLNKRNRGITLVVF